MIFMKFQGYCYLPTIRYCQAIHYSHENHIQKQCITGQKKSLLHPYRVFDNNMLFTEQCNYAQKLKIYCGMRNDERAKSQHIFLCLRIYGSAKIKSRLKCEFHVMYLFTFLVLIYIILSEINYNNIQNQGIISNANWCLLMIDIPHKNQT